MGPDPHTTVLYMLSTLAQTCAALAALIGAVGLYRLQQLHGEREEVFDDLHSNIGRPVEGRDRLLEHAREKAQSSPAIAGALDLLATIRKRVYVAVAALIVFEVWQMGSILFALLGFYCVSSPKSVTGLFTIAAVGAVLTTIGCIAVWTWPRRVADGKRRR